MIAFFAAFSLQHHVDTAVRATLSDGQILMGEVRTKVLRLASGVGDLEVPLADVGEVKPVRGDKLGSAEGQVDIWLRNGSELRGRWADPELAMGIAVGGKPVAVNLPMNQLTRFQLQARPEWSNEAVYRMKTSFGDDFLVDPSRTRVQIDNQLGSFSPVLTECRSVAPIGDPEGDWRIELETGTVLVGKLHDNAVTVALPMGPDAVTVPLKNFVSLRMETWQPQVPTPPVYGPVVPDHTVPYGYPAVDREDVSSGGYPGAQQAEAVAAPLRKSPTHKRSGAPAPATAAPAQQGEWFDSSALDDAKQAQDPK